MKVSIFINAPKHNPRQKPEMSFMYTLMLNLTSGFTK